MSKIRMKGKFEEEKDVLDLINKFFKNFNPESSIDVQGKEVQMEIVFEQQPPMEIINAIKNCINIQLKFCEECRENDAEQKIAGDESIKQDETTEKLASMVSKKVEFTEKKKKPKNIPELEEIAKKATSFDHFAKLIAKWLEMDEKEETFRKLLIASTVVDKIGWKELKNIGYTEYDIYCSSHKLKKKLKEVSLMNFLKAVRKYKEYSFHEETNEILDPKPTRVKMNCMPEIKDFEETLASVDKTWSIDERVRYVLEVMGLQEKVSFKDQEEMIEVVSKLLKEKNMDSDIIFSGANILRMRLSELVNDFVQKYEMNKKVKLLTFLSELQKLIVSESEIESSSDI